MPRPATRTQLVLLFLLLSPVASAAEIATVAGVGLSGAAGDGGPAVAARMGNPYGLTLGPDGALYVCEVDTQRIRRIDLAGGGISTVAGSGVRGYAGDGGPAVAARLNEPYEVRFDRAGAMYFVEMRNAVVRRVDARSGTIETIAGTGEAGFSGDGGPARQAALNRPHSIALDGKGSLYIADIGNHRIRRVDLASGLISTFAGTGERLPTPHGAPIEGTPLNGPRALAFDGAGDMFLALREGNAVYKLDMGRRRIEHIAGTGEKGYAGDGGPARRARLSGPKGIEIGPDNAAYIADTESHTIRRIDLASGTIATVAGTGARGDGPDGGPLQCALARPHGIYIDARGTLYIGDSENHRVRVLRK